MILYVEQILNKKFRLIYDIYGDLKFSAFIKIMITTIDIIIIIIYLF